MSHISTAEELKRLEYIKLKKKLLELKIDLAEDEEKDPDELQDIKDEMLEILEAMEVIADEEKEGLSSASLKPRLVMALKSLV